MIDRFQGDPKLYFTPDGIDLKFESGQPVMDQGIENQATISLFGGRNWWGNSLIDDINQHLDSDFEEVASGAITLQKLEDIKQSAERNLKSKAFGEITAEVLNPVAWRIDLNVNIKPPGRDVQELRLTLNSQNWQNQAIDPAYLK